MYVFCDLSACVPKKYGNQMGKLTPALLQCINFTPKNSRQMICVCLSFRMSYIHPSSLLSHTLEELARLNKQSRFDSAPILSHVTCRARHTWIVFGPQLQKSRHDCHKSQNSVKQSEARCQSWHRWLKCQHYRAPCLWSSQPRYPDTYPFFFTAVQTSFCFKQVLFVFM